MHPVKSKSNADLAHEWDQLARLRLEQISRGDDISYSNILVPCVTRLIEGCSLTSLLDVGCGVGVLTQALAERADSVTAIDISSASIQLARTVCSSQDNIQFHAISIEDFSSTTSNAYSCAIANMTLMDVLDLNGAVQAISSLLQEGSHFIFTITHPCFWSQYWQYSGAKWFDYSKEILIEAPFNISLGSQTDLVTTHVHRPLEMYINVLSSVGMCVQEIIEPMPDQTLMDKYPKKWLFPRFLAMKCRKE